MATNEIEIKDSSAIQIFNREQFARKFDPAEMAIEHRHVNTLVKAVEADKNSIAVHRKELDEDTVLAAIEMHLLSLCASLNVHESLGELQAKEIAYEIMSTHYYLSFVEIHHVLRLGKTGKFGPIKFSIDISTIMTWFKRYCDDRVEHFAEQSAQGDNKYKTGKFVETDEDGNSKLFDVKDERLSELQMSVLKQIRDKMASVEGCDEEEYQAWKKQYNDNCQPGQ